MKVYITKDVDLFEGDFKKNVIFKGPQSLENDLETLKEKWKNHPSSVFVHHMIDSLIIFKHNMEQYNNYYSIPNRDVNKKLNLFDFKKEVINNNPVF